MCVAMYVKECQRVLERVSEREEKTIERERELEKERQKLDRERKIKTE